MNAYNLQFVEAKTMILDITAAKIPDPGFTNHIIGKVSININNNHKVNILANISTIPNQGKVFEDWLANTGVYNYKLSLGQVVNNHLNF